jgi:hypothetical protein
MTDTPATGEPVIPIDPRHAMSLRIDDGGVPVSDKRLSK